MKKLIGMVLSVVVVGVVFMGGSFFLNKDGNNVHAENANDGNVKKEEIKPDREDIDDLVNKQDYENVKMESDEKNAYAHFDGNLAIRDSHVLTRGLNALETSDKHKFTQENYKDSIEKIIKGMGLINHDGENADDIDRVLNLAIEIYNQDHFNVEDERYQEMHDLMEKLDNKYNGSNAYEYKGE